MKKLLLLVLLVIEVSSGNELPLKISDKTWSISTGLGTNRNFYFLGISKDLRINNNFSCFITTGIPIPSAFGAGGENFFGTGMSFQNNYNNKGFNIALNYGLQLIGELEDSKYYIWYAVANYQWKIGKQLFLSSGLMAGWYYTEGVILSYGNPIQKSEKSGYALPTISLDYRF